MKRSEDILVMCKPDPSGNPRPRRMIELCNSLGFEVDVVSQRIKNELQIRNHYELSGYVSKNLFKVIVRKAKTLTGLFINFLINRNDLKEFFHSSRHNIRHIKSSLSNNNYGIIIVEDLYLLPMALSYKGSAKVIFDAREYYPKQYRDSFSFKYVDKPERTWICKEYLHKCDAIITVSQGLAEEYKKEFGVDSTVVRSTPTYYKQHVNKVDAESIKMVHHGVASRNRKLENLIKITEKLDDRFSLDLYLENRSSGRKAYVEELKKFAGSTSRIRFHEPVPFEQIVPTLNKYDIGLFYVEPTTFNLKHCLPNKLFEFIQARLMVAIGPSPDMSKIVREYNCGLVSNSFNVLEIATLLNNLTPEEILRAKKCSDAAAKELCFEQESLKLVRIIRSLLDESSSFTEKASYEPA